MIWLNLSNKIKAMRISMGLTQSRLAQESSVSIPTIQNIEAGHANPSIETVLALLSVMGGSLEVKLEPPQWPLLIACGLPLALCPSEGDDKPSLKALVTELRRALNQPLDQRERDAVVALLLGLRDHFPTVFSIYFSGSAIAALMNITVEASPGRLLKLRRTTLTKLSEYL